MRVLLAEDDPVSRHLVKRLMVDWGYEVIEATDGEKAWEIMRGPGAPRMAVLDWVMPELDGIEVCRRLRKRKGADYVYVILLTAKRQKEDIVVGLDAGADDYITKPFDDSELRSRLRVGRRILELEDDLSRKVNELEEALGHVKQLQGLLPICMHCKKIRDDKNTWHRLETYIEENSEALFSHALCEECMAKFYPSVKKDDEPSE
jgi:DNA-binding response OmpR family regulator